MITPFNPYTLFEVNENFVVSTVSDDYIIIDDFYKNYDDILEVINNMAVPIFKYSEESRNFIDYYDCRPTINVNDFNEKTLVPHKTCANLIREYFNETRTFGLVTDIFEFNFFKHLKTDIPNKYQHFPHRDYSYTGLVYLDQVCSGGTALYDDSVRLSNKEHLNILYDTSSLDKKILLAKPNRLVIFKGTRLHGGYIENHNDYTNDWRINQCIFFEFDDKS